LENASQAFVTQVEYGFLKLGSGALLLEMIHCNQPSIEAVTTQVSRLRHTA